MRANDEIGEKRKRFSDARTDRGCADHDVHRSGRNRSLHTRTIKRVGELLAVAAARAALREFREHGDAVLLGTASFWEGVDVKGEALRLVIIEKLPFASPDDPLTKARIEHLQRSGGNAFRDYQLPEAVLALKQGVGRLIRSETDRGMIVICDPRLLGKGYGRVFRASLPEMPATRDRAEATRFLRRLKT